jgi:hypothetical protein
MGLDQFAYSVDNTGNKTEISYWRKHPNLQGWMENLWYKKGCPNAHEDNPSEFNCVPMTLDYNDLDNLENDIKNKGLPSTDGFFFGDNSNEYYYQQDLEFVEHARNALDSDLSVVYDSSW